MEITANSVQTVATGQNILYTETVVAGNQCILHREGSGIVKLRGLTNQCRARFKITFNGNIAIPTSGTVGAISAAIAISGEPVAATNMIVTPAAGENYFNIASVTFVDVPSGCCTDISVKNTSTQDILVQNANFIIERVA